jgi:hypothetical protein
MSDRRDPRIFYCGMVNTAGYAEFLGESLHIGAASNKMLAVVRAIRDVDARAYLVSIPVLGRNVRRAYAPDTVLRNRDAPQVFLPVFAHPYLRKIYALFSFAWFCVAKVRRSDRVLLYNHSIEYLLGLIILALKGNRPILDVEDAPRLDEHGWRGFVGRSLFFLFFRLVCDRKLIVSESLAEMLGLSHYCVVYGAARSSSAPIRIVNQSFGRQDTSGPIRIHYGGSLDTNTGVDLFCGAVDQLIGSLRRDICQVHFIVTGFGSEMKIKELEKRCAGTGVLLSFYPDLSPEGYIDQFRRCHAALSLKLPESEMAITTFPSKVVEITSQGFLLISTKASDVPRLFDASSAVILPEATAGALAGAIMSVLADPMGMQQVAKRGQARALELFESKAVGKRIVDFVLYEKT